MSLTLKQGDNDFEKLEKGIYHATCFRMVDLGTQDNTYKGETNKKLQVRLDFEITEALDPDTNQVLMADGRPFGVGKEYTASLFESANLRKDLESWRGKSFTQEELDSLELTDFLGCTVKIEVGLTQQTAEFAGGNPKIMRLSEPRNGTEQVATVNPQVAFDMSVYCDEFNGNSNANSKAMCDVFEDIPAYLQKKVEESYEYRAAVEKGARASTVEVEAPAESLADLASSSDDDDKLPF
jgi:hypothetical protein